MRSAGESGSGLAPSHVDEGLSMEGTIQPESSRSAAKGSPPPGSGRTRTRVWASARSLRTSAAAKASTSSTPHAGPVRHDLPPRRLPSRGRVVGAAMTPEVAGIRRW